MFNQYQEVQHKDCPNCKVGKAYMGSSSWGHGIICCSDKCGEAIAEKLKVNTSRKKYKKAVKQLEKAKEKVHDIKYQGIDACDPFPSL